MERTWGPICGLTSSLPAGFMSKGCGTSSALGADGDQKAGFYFLISKIVDIETPFFLEEQAKQTIFSCQDIVPVGSEATLLPENRSVFGW